MKNYWYIRVISVLLAVIFIVAAMPVSAFAEAIESIRSSAVEYVSTFKSVESTLAPGITQSVNSGYGADGKLINYYIAVADINRSDVGIQATYKDAQSSVAGMAKMTEQAVSMTELHSNPNDKANYIPYYAVVAGVNGDGYDTGSGKPSGVHIMNGVAGFGVAKTANSSWFAVFEDGTALCGANDADWDEAIAAHGAAKEAIGGFQLVRKNGVDCSYSSGSYLNDGRYPRSFVGVTADNKVVFMVADGNGAGGSVGTNWQESVEIMTDAGCTYILCLDGGGSATYISRPEGSDDIQVSNVPSDGSERAVSNGLIMYTTTPPSDTFDHANVTTEDSYILPGVSTNISAIGVSPAGTSAKIPDNAVWSVTGGTLENGVFTAGNTVGDATVSLVVDGNVVGSTTIHIVLPDTIAFSRSTVTVPYGKTVELAVTAKKGVNTVKTSSDSFTITLEDGTAGSLSGMNFTAAESGTGTKVTATLKADPSISAYANIVLGKGSETLMGFEKDSVESNLSNWRVSNHGGYTVADLSIVTAETGKVHSGSQALAFHYPMDEALHGTEFWAGNSIVWQGESIEIEKATSIGFWVYIPEDAKRFSIYFAVSTHDEDGNFAGKSGESIEIYNEDSVNGIEYSGWHYFSIPLDNAKNYYIEDNADCIGKYYNGSQFKFKANCFIEFYAVNIESWKYDETNYAGDFTFYIDDITIDYSDAVDDREAPIFSDITYATAGMSDAASLNGQTIAQNKISFAASVAENMTNASNATGLDEKTAVAYIDGKLVSCVYANGKITIEDVILTDGTHTIRFGICDKEGNYSETKRQITVKTGNKDASVRVQPKDSTLKYILNGAVYWIDIEADNVENIKSVELKLDLDSMNNWELDHIETLYGFDLTYSFATAAEKAENILTVKITRNDKYLAETGTAVLASLPIRVWDYKASDDHQHANAVEAWNCKYVCAPALSIDVDTEMGVVTYLDGTSHTFSSEDIHTLCVSYTYGVYLRDYCGTFYSEHSYHVHTEVAVEDVAPTCTTSGYIGRTVCKDADETHLICTKTVHTHDSSCYNSENKVICGKEEHKHVRACYEQSCNSIINWGTTLPATGHSFKVVDDVLKCSCGEKYNGTYEGVYYIDGVVANGWTEDDTYYANGVMLTGIQVIEGYYYDLGEDGVCKGKMKLTGLLKLNDKWYFSKQGTLVVGWHQIDGNWHFFCGGTKNAAVGTMTYRGVTYDFNEQGMTKGAWYNDGKGIRYSYGPGDYEARSNDYMTFHEIDGKIYNFDVDGYLTIGIQALMDGAFVLKKYVYDFGTDGALVKQISTKGTIMGNDGSLYYINDEGYVPMDAGLIQDGTNYYYILYSGKVAVNQTRYISASKSNGLLAAGNYTFGADGNVLNGVYEDLNGNLCYYRNGNVASATYNGELIEINGAIYFVKWSGKVAVNETRTVSETKTNGLLPAGTYIFGEDGKILNGVQKGTDGNLYYYKNSKVVSGTYNGELVEIDGDIYFVKWSGKVAVNETRAISTTKTNGLLPAGTYNFSADGKIELINGVHEEADGNLYYYQNNAIVSGMYNGELVEIDGDIYFVKWSGKVAVNETRTVSETKTNGLLPAGTYIFGEDGKILNGIQKGTDGNLYYYKNSKVVSGTYNGELVEIDGDIYFVKWSGKVAVNETRAISTTKTNGLLPAGTYYFGEDGKLQTSN